MTGNIDLAHAREVALSASDKASKLLRERFGTPLDITSKGHADFVTELDGQCEEIIREELSYFDDSIFFMGEESTEFTTDETQVVIDLPSTCWIVDPLDGTSNYSHTFGAFAVSIGLRVANELSVGVVQAPVTGDLMYATKGEGAWRQNFSGESVRLSTVDRGNSHNLFATAVPFRHPEYIPGHVELINRLYGIFEDLRRVGAAALDLGWVASGPWAAYIEMFLKPWDSAAGGLLVREAGGIITDFSGDEQAWLTNGEIIASASPRVHEQILSLIE
ncbi:MAG TPA: inositol monophosphatase family protein [Acidimicrobiia bacterium]|nr:inositol monophosphatase family protein [Acidimicrobiia bacterium]